MRRQRRREVVKRKPIKSRGFTDKIYLLNLVLTWSFMLVCVLLTAFSGILGVTDFTIVTIGLPTAFGELAVHSGFVINKAKVENLSKYGNESQEQEEFNE